MVSLFKVACFISRIFSTIFKSKNKSLKEKDNFPRVYLIDNFLWDLNDVIYLKRTKKSNLNILILTCLYSFDTL